MEGIRRALTVAVPRGRRTFKQAELPQPLKDLIWAKNRARKRYQESWSSKRDLKALTHQAKNGIKKWRDSTGTRGLQLSIPRTARSGGSLDHLTKEETSHPPAHKADSHAYSEEDKAKVLVQSFTKVHKSSFLCGDESFCEKVMSAVRKLSTPKKRLVITIDP